MSDLDKARVLRLKGTVDAQLAVKASVMSGEALSLAAVEVRARIADALPADLRAEFVGDFPEQAAVRTADPLRLAQAAEAGQVRLRGISGWLGGLAEGLER